MTDSTPLRMSGKGCGGIRRRKSQIPNPKSQIISKAQFPNLRCRSLEFFWSLDVWSLGFPRFAQLHRARHGRHAIEPVDQPNDRRQSQRGGGEAAQHAAVAE